MKITPLDLRNQEFGRTFRGYDPEEVRVFLELVSDEFEFLIKENTSLTERVRDLDEKIRDYRNMEKTLNQTLISAQTNAENYFENAKKEANMILENAQMECRRLLEQTRNQKIALDEEISRLRKSRQTYIRKIRSFLSDQLEMLAGEEVDFGAVEETNPGEEDREEGVPIPASDMFRPTFSVDVEPEEEPQRENPGDSYDPGEADHNR